MTLPRLALLLWCGAGCASPVAAPPPPAPVAEPPPVAAPAPEEAASQEAPPQEPEVEKALLEAGVKKTSTGIRDSYSLGGFQVALAPYQGVS